MPSVCAYSRSFLSQASGVWPGTPLIRVTPILRSQPSSGCPRARLRGPTRTPDGWQSPRPREASWSAAAFCGFVYVTAFAFAALALAQAAQAAVRQPAGTLRLARLFDPATLDFAKL